MHPLDAAADPGPTASFTHTPGSPQPGETVTFTSTSTPAAGHEITSEAWDLDNDGKFDDALGPTAERSFGSAGPTTVSLLVVDDDDQEDVASELIVVGNQPPAASFLYIPSQPVAGETVTFFSTSTDSDSPIGSQSWDLDADGLYDEASGPSASVTFPLPGSYTVGLLVVDSEGASAVALENVFVVASPSTSTQGRSSARILSPFPIVRISGSIRKRGIRLRRFTVSVPLGTTITIRCGGHGCPFRRQSRTVPGPPLLTGEAALTKLIHVRRLERRLIRTGVIVKVFVTRPGAVGKFTRFRVRRRRPPVRSDRCLLPGGFVPVRCPAN